MEVTAAYHKVLTYLFSPHLYKFWLPLYEYEQISLNDIDKYQNLVKYTMCHTLLGTLLLSYYLIQGGTTMQNYFHITQKILKQKD